MSKQAKMLVKPHLDLVDNTYNYQYGNVLFDIACWVWLILNQVNCFATK